MEKIVLKKVKLSTVLYLLVAIVLALFSLSLIFSYALPVSKPWVKYVVDRSPYPLVLIGYTQAISLHELSENLLSVKRFYEAQDFSQVGLRIDFSTEEGQKRLKVREKEVFNKMVEDEAIRILAEKRDIRITEEMAAQGVARTLEEYKSSEGVKENLERLYGWTLKDFEEKIVLPSLYEEKLRESFEKEVDTTGAAKEKITQARKLLDEKTSFGEVAREHSDGETAEKGGELGWFTLEDLAPELRKAVALQKVGVPSEVIESALGFHIVLVEEVKKDKERQLYRLSQIFARKETFPQWLTERMKELPVWVLSREYYWDREAARVEFKAEEMRQFEEELYKKSNGDAMFFF